MQKRSKRLCLVLAVLLSVSMALVALAPAVEAASYKKGSSGFKRPFRIQSIRFQSSRILIRG